MLRTWGIFRQCPSTSGRASAVSVACFRVLRTSYARRPRPQWIAPLQLSLPTCASVPRESTQCSTANTTLFLIRHGEKQSTEKPNPGLTTAGRAQAAQIVLSVDCVVVSPLRRALQTYTEAHIETRQLVVSPLFREFQSAPSCYLELEAVVQKEARSAFLDRVHAARKFLADLVEHTAVRNTFGERRHSGEGAKVAIISHEEFLFALYQELGVKPVHHAPGEVRQVSFVAPGVTLWKV